MPASKLLANIALDRGQRAYIGKVCVRERERDRECACVIVLDCGQRACIGKV